MRLSAADYDMKLKREGKLRMAEVDQSIASWIFDRESSAVAVSGGLIREMGEHFVQATGSVKTLTFSDGWLRCFKRRHRIKAFKLHGESADVNEDAVHEALPGLVLLTAQYAPQDIFNADETGVFFSMSPRSTIARKRIKGRKKAKDRLTVMPVTNADGSEKRRALFLGTAVRPRVFKGRTPSEAGFLYEPTDKGWMTQPVFKRWLEAFNEDMRVQERHVLLLIDNCPAHKLTKEVTPVDKPAIKMSNLSVHFLPKNTTARLQPLDAGVIASFKRQFLKRKMREACKRDQLGCDNPYKMDVRTAMETIEDAWDSVEQQIIVNCWKHCGFVYHYADSIGLDMQVLGGLSRLTLSDE